MFNKSFVSNPSETFYCHRTESVTACKHKSPTVKYIKPFDFLAYCALKFGQNICEYILLTMAWTAQRKKKPLVDDKRENSNKSKMIGYGRMDVSMPVPGKYGASSFVLTLFCYPFISFPDHASYLTGSYYFPMHCHAFRWKSNPINAYFTRLIIDYSNQISSSKPKHKWICLN